MNNLEQMPNEENMNQQQRRPRPPQPAAQNCPRCGSFNTKFCYYNNYNLSQPRHFCKTCKRYWTHGGTLRDVPVGGGGKRARTAAASSSLASALARTTPSISTASLLPQNRPGIVPEQFPRALPSVMPSVINSFTEDGARFSSLMMQSTVGINQGTNVGLGVEGGTHLGPNMALLQRLTLPGLAVPQVPQQSQLQTNFYSSQQNNMVLPRVGLSWTQSLLNFTVANSFGAGPSFRSGDQASSSVNPSPPQWSADNLPGFDPSRP